MMLDALVSKLRTRDRVSAEEMSALEGLFGAGIREIPSHADIVREGERPHVSTLVIEGWCARYKLLAGGTRQFTALHLPGDFVDLHSFLVKKLDHSVLALTACRVITAPHERLIALTETHPHLARMLWLETLIDGATHREWLVAMGRKQAIQRLAQLVCELCVRLRIIDQGTGLTFRIPLTQAELGDLLGLSTVHVNRVLQDLRRDGLLSWEGATVTIKDWDGLAELCEFDPTYLQTENEPR